MAELDPNVDWAAIASGIDSARKLYPDLAWMLDIPEVGSILVRAALEGWDSGRLTSAIHATSWWTQRNDAQRAWMELSTTNPGQAETQQRSLASQMMAWASQNGITMTQDEAIYIAGLALTNGNSQAEWQAAIVKRYIGENGQSAQPVIDQLKAMASQYAVPMSEATIKQWEMQILTGQVNQATFESYLREQAKSLFPGLANAIDRGITVAQYVQPYAQIAVQELGINPNEIDWTNPKWNTAIHQIDPKSGTPVAMSLSDWTRTLRSDPIYGYGESQRGMEQASSLGQALAQMFGVAA